MDAVRKTVASLVSIGNFVKTKRSDIAHFKWSEFANPFGWSPLMSAAFHGSAAMVKLLLDFGCPVGEVTWGGHSALVVAALRGHDAVVRMLAEGGALNHDTPDRLGYTAFHFACSACSLETVRLLVALGTNVNTVSLLGATPLSNAQVSGLVDTVEYLRGLGALEGAVDADAKFNIMRAAITPQSGSTKDNVVDLMSFHNVRTLKERSTTIVDGTVVRYVNWRPGSDYEMSVRSDLAALEDALTNLNAGGSTHEVYGPLRFSVARHMMPYLVFRKGTVYTEAPLYFEAATYGHYLIQVFDLLDAGIDCSVAPMSYPQF